MFSESARRTHVQVLSTVRSKYTAGSTHGKRAWEAREHPAKLGTAYRTWPRQFGGGNKLYAVAVRST